MAVRYVYHGTDEATALRALREGLQPRSKSGRLSNWGEISHPDMVYLTRYWPGYFALHAVPDQAERFGLVEVDLDKLDPDKLHPDEDYVEQVTRAKLRALVGDDLTVRTKFVRERLPLMKKYTFRSLHHMGNVAHLGTIPPAAIRRVAVVNVGANPMLLDNLLGPEISPRNADVMGPFYEKLVSIMFGDPVTAAELINWDGMAEHWPEGHMFQKMRVNMAEQLLLRDGLSEIHWNRKWA